MASETNYLDMVRQAESYPGALRAARCYFGGFAWMIISAFVVAGTGLSFQYFLVTAVAIPFIVVGVLGARKAWASLERELPGTEVKSASTIATFQDLLRRR